MSEVPNVSNTSGTTAAQGTGGQTTPTGTTSGYSPDTKIASMEQLKTEAPEVHKAMMEGIAQSIISKMRASQERLKKMWDESRRQD